MPTMVKKNIPEMITKKTYILTKRVARLCCVVLKEGENRFDGRLFVKRCWWRLTNVKYMTNLKSQSFAYILTPATILDYILCKILKHYYYGRQRWSGEYESRTWWNVKRPSQIYSPSVIVCDLDYLPLYTVCRISHWNQKAKWLSSWDLKKTLVYVVRHYF